MSHTPSISVLMPIYNGGEYLKAAIQSVLDQSFSDFELIIVNDASKDQSEETILSFTDSRIKYHRNQLNLGLVGSLNVGLGLCTGKYIARMDQDDIARSNRFQKQFDFLESNSDYIVVGSHVQIIGNDILYYPTSDASIKTRLLIATPFAHPAVMMRASILTSNNLLYLETYKHAEDYGFWVELSRFGKMANLDEVLLDYRRHGSQYSVEYKIQMNQAAAKARYRYLDTLHVQWDAETRETMNKALEYYRTCSSQSELIECGRMLANSIALFEKTILDKNELNTLAKKTWKKLCTNFIKTSPYQAYVAFIKNTLSKNTGVKTHLFFMKSIFLASFKQSTN